MKYMGSKNRIGKYIIPIITENLKKDQWYIEPFVGGGNLIDKINHKKRIGIDLNKYTIRALKIIKNNLDILPKTNKEFTENDYNKIKKDKNNILYGYVGFALSYGGKFYGGWRRDSEQKRDYVKEAYNNACKQSPNLQSVSFYYNTFNNFSYPKNSIIYCDPPYRNTTKYNSIFNYNLFYKWCVQLKNKGHNVFISEYEMPKEFKCIWEKEIVSSLTKNTGAKKGTEKIFIVR